MCMRELLVFCAALLLVAPSVALANTADFGSTDRARGCSALARRVGPGATFGTRHRKAGRSSVRRQVPGVSWRKGCGQAE